MTRRKFLEFGALLAAAGMLTGPEATAAEGGGAAAVDPAKLKAIQEKMGYSDEEMKQFLDNPRNQKILARLKAMAGSNVVFEIVKSHGCLVGHRPGERFIFPGAGGLDTANSAAKLCPYLMPPMTRTVAIIQERLFEGLPPEPLFSIGQCDDVGLDCNGLGRVIIEARIEKRLQEKSSS